MSRFLSLWIAVAVGFIPSDGLGQVEQAKEQGTLIQIGPDHGNNLHDGHDHEHLSVSRYWIGIAGGPVPPELRSHLRMDEAQGVIVREIRPNSPADEGGFEKYDVIVGVNGDPIDSMQQIAAIVADQGKMEAQLAIEVIRHGQNETVYVTPIEKTFQRKLAPSPRRPRRPFGGDFAEQAFGLSITRNGDTPAKITVRRNDETWELDADDPESLAQLPEDIRPLVEQAMEGGPAAGFLSEMLEENSGGMPFGFDLGGTNDAELQRRFQEMELQVKELRRRFGVPKEPALTEPPPLQLQEGPAEIELPAES